MKTRYLLLALLFTITIAVVSYRVAYSFFSYSAQSTANVFAAASTFPTPTPTQPPIATTLVFNEFVWDTTCGNNASQQAADYWIELYNGSAVTEDLQGWQFRDADGTVIGISNSSKTVNSGQYVILTKDGSVFSGGDPCFVKQGTPVEANLGGNDDFLPASTGGVVILERPDGSGGFIVVDRVEYGPTLNGGVLNAPKDQSIARTPNGVDTAAGNTFNATDFAIDTTPSPGVSN